jgi:hypothetical protein
MAALIALALSPQSMDDRMAPFVRAGRAVFGVVLEGYVERLRPPGYTRPNASTVEFVELVVTSVTDLRPFPFTS